jgi:D-alanyl-D-alanine carboxypeptidase/D-alanyl-D-alanine-endopeptidase (penicillin-binding protein 4)
MTRQVIFIISKLFYALAATFMMFPFSLVCQTPVALLSEIQQLKSDKDLLQCSWGFYAIETSTKKIVADYNSELLLEPASVLKVLTTGAALNLLGEDFQFSTQLAYSGNIDKAGVLHGNLYIIGGGDPTIGSPLFPGAHCDSVFKKFKTALANANIKEINGHIVADASVFDDNALSDGWIWEDIGNYYAGGAFGINVHENFYSVLFNAGINLGDSAYISGTENMPSEMQLINHVTTAAANSGDNCFIYGSPYTYQRLLQGTVPQGKKNYPVDGSLPDPPLYFAGLFYQSLREANISITGIPTTTRIEKIAGITDSPTKTIISEYKSPKLSQIIYYTNLKSNNLFAEAILKIIGKSQNGTGSAQSGVQAMVNYYKNQTINLDGLVMEDGCGLSRLDKISTRQLTEVLANLASKKTFTTFSNSLPMAGISGGMAGMCKNTVAEKNLRAKTGNMTKIKSYAGYVTNAAGKKIAFSIIFNNYGCSNAALKQKIEKLMVLMAESK